MLAVVIPARNEAACIQDVLRAVLRLPVGLVIPVLNGCTDATGDLVGRTGDRRVRPLKFQEALGYDVPRIAGARAAAEQGARAVMFVDGDLSGRLEGGLYQLFNAARKGLDLALADCYTGTAIPYRNSTARAVYESRLALNRALRRSDLGAAIPSHGPAAVSLRLLETVPLATVGVPPLMLAHALQAGLDVGIGAHIPHGDLGSARRDREHRQRIAETIIGDCLEGLCLAEGRAPDRKGHMGYHGERRFELVGLKPPGAVGDVAAPGVEASDDAAGHAVSPGE